MTGGTIVTRGLGRTVQLLVTSGLGRDLVLEPARNKGWFDRYRSRQLDEYECALVGVL